MTNDFKNNVLDWLTGNYNIETGVDEPQFSVPTEKTNNFKTQFEELFPNGYFIHGSLQASDNKNNKVGYTIIYGTYLTTSAMKGFIVILDEDFDIIQAITKYSTGTDLNYIEILGVGDDGNFFGIELLPGTTKRFIMLNNIVAKLPTEQNYSVILRQSYNLVGASTTIQEYSTIIKATGQSKYLIVGTNNGAPIVTELVINVGSENEWNDFTYSGTGTFDLADTYASWDTSGNLIFKTAGFQIENNTNLKLAVFSGNSESEIMTLNTYGETYESVNTYSLKILNMNEIYFSIITYTGNMCYIKHFNNGTITTLYEATTSYINYADFKIHIVEGNIYVLLNKDFIIRICQIINDTLYQQEIAPYTINENPMLSIIKQFNLVNFYIQDGDVVYNTKEIYNSNNYNGEPYQSLNSMVSNSAILYDNNRVVIFARNIYNRVINNNMTTSTVEVPNNFINNITIKNKELISQTNNILNTDSTEVVTNIYEELLINFINALIMENRNNPDNIISNIVGASRLNNSISNPLKLDYQNAKATKCKINFIDNTSNVQNIKWVKINNYYQTNIFLYVKKGIKNIQIISEDEETIYQTINGEFEQNKFYNIKQDVWIIEKEEQ